MRIKFWGVRGSLPAPLSREDISAKIAQALYLAKDTPLKTQGECVAFVEGLPAQVSGTIGGNTSCVEVLTDSAHIVFDVGSGARALGNHLMSGVCGQGRGEIHLFMSHTHWDHIQGFPFFVPAYIPGNKIFIYSPKKDIAQKFETQQVDQDMFPVRIEDMGAQIIFVPLDGGAVTIGQDIRVTHLPMRHPGGCHSYRIEENGKSLVYATDAEYPDPRGGDMGPILDFFSNADLLIFDSMYTFMESKAKAGWGHSTSLIGVDLAARANVKRLVLFHHEPNYSDAKLKEIITKTITYNEIIKQNSGLEVILASEGLNLEV